MLGNSGVSSEIEIVAEYVREGAWPFRVDPITITHETYHSGVSFFDVQTKVGNFRYAFSEQDVSYLWDTSLLVEQFGIAAARAFREHRIEPETNIVLGEN
jgi:hypothetical protein